MAELVAEDAPIIRFLKSLPSQSDGLTSIRQKAWERFTTLGLPDRKTEVFRYIPLHKLYSRSFRQTAKQETVDITPHILPENPQSVLVFVNGEFRQDLSKTYAIPKRVVISTISDALRTYGSFLNSHFARTLKEEADAFTALNLAAHEQGLFVYIPPKTYFDVPLQILYLSDGVEGSFSMPRVQLFAGSQSELTLSVVHATMTPSSAAYTVSSAIDLSLEEGAHVKVSESAEQVGKNAWIFDSVRVQQKRGSTFRSAGVTDGAVCIRRDYRVNLLEEGAEVDLNGLWMLKEDKEAHVHILVDHQAPNCRSNQTFKGVLNNTAKSSFEGKIFVRQAAQKTEAYQLNQNMVLSDQATAYSKPNLEIFADDVKASHGSTTGQFEKELLFYLQTRGFSHLEAKNLLIGAFCREIVDRLPQISLRERATEDFSKNFLEG